jgi:hypothetical protein
VTEDAQGWQAGVALLRERDFPRLFSARLGSAFGTSMGFVALPFAVLELVRSDNPAPVGYVLAYQTGLRHDEIVSGLRVRDFGGTAEGDVYTIDVRAHGSWTPKAHAERSVPMPETAIF